MRRRMVSKTTQRRVAHQKQGHNYHHLHGVAVIQFQPGVNAAIAVICRRKLKMYVAKKGNVSQTFPGLGKCAWMLMSWNCVLKSGLILGMTDKTTVPGLSGKRPTDSIL